jgi:hypothetical protein
MDIYQNNPTIFPSSVTSPMAGENDWRFVMRHLVLQQIDLGIGVESETVVGRRVLLAANIWTSWLISAS